MQKKLKRRAWSGLVAASALLNVGEAVAQTDSTTRTPPRRDSVRVYRLGEIAVTDERPERITPARIDRIGLPRIDASDAATVSELAYLVPGARIQTNSRGESLLYLRNAGERQVAVFFDGALLNIPWDNRVDLSLVPLNAVGGMTVAKGIPSALYGANVIGGAVNIISQELREPGSLTEATVQLGSGSLAEGTLTHIGNTGTFNYIGSFGYLSRRGIPLPDTAALRSDAEAPFAYNQTDPTLRTNTDSRIVSAFVRGEYTPDALLRLGLSVNFIDAEKGVAPEGHTEKPRFWRYPDWRNLSVALNGDLRFGAGRSWDLKGTVWWTGFSQAIDQYTSASYALRGARQEDEDNTLGARVLLGKEFGVGGITLALNALGSSHDQTDLSYDSTGALKPFRNAAGERAPYPVMRYRQEIYSIGGEYEAMIATGLRVAIGGSFDAMRTPKTGDKPPHDGFSDFGYSTGIVYEPLAGALFRLTTGRKSRFPTMRELYGEALGRFLPNPDLKPEESSLLEIGAEARGRAGSIAVTGFGSRTSNTIDQRALDTLGGEKRQRINLAGSRALGVELAAELRAVPRLYIDGHITYSNSRALVPDGSDSSFTGYLAERPEMLATLTARYDLPFGLQPMIELVRTGQAFSPTGGGFVPLGPSTVLNVRLAWRTILPMTRNSAGELFLRIDNITDEVVLPQLGLPAAGRELRAGMKLTL